MINNFPLDRAPVRFRAKALKVESIFAAVFKPLVVPAPPIPVVAPAYL